MINNERASSLKLRNFVKESLNGYLLYWFYVLLVPPNINPPRFLNKILLSLISRYLVSALASVGSEGSKNVQGLVELLLKLVPWSDTLTDVNGRAISGEELLSRIDRLLESMSSDNCVNELKGLFEELYLRLVESDDISSITKGGIYSPQQVVQLVDFYFAKKHETALLDHQAIAELVALQACVWRMSGFWANIEDEGRGFCKSYSSVLLHDTAHLYLSIYYLYLQKVGILEGLLRLDISGLGGTNKIEFDPRIIINYSHISEFLVQAVEFIGDSRGRLRSTKSLTSHDETVDLSFIFRHNYGYAMVRAKTILTILLVLLFQDLDEEVFISQETFRYYENIVSKSNIISDSSLGNLNYVKLVEGLINRGYIDSGNILNGRNQKLQNLVGPIAAFVERLMFIVPENIVDYFVSLDYQGEIFDLEELRSELMEMWSTK